MTIDSSDHGVSQTAVAHASTLFSCDSSQLELALLRGADGMQLNEVAEAIHNRHTITKVLYILDQTG